MPQVYRRHSDYAPRPSLVPRRRSALPPPQPSPTDADDSIVLADLVRTGEASRLRRRGAMRLDHAAASVAAPPVGGVPMRRSSYALPPTTRVIEPTSRSPSPGRSRRDRERGLEMEPEEDGADEYTYSASPAWRDFPTGPRVVERRGEVDVLTDGAHTSQAYVLYCGGEIAEDVVEEEVPPPRFKPALFPSCPSPVASSSASAHNKPARRTNGCGALVHVRAFLQHPRGVWMAKEDAAEAVVALDAEYCDHPAMDKMLRSACGCVREGIGCAAWCVAVAVASHVVRLKLTVGYC